MCCRVVFPSAMWFLLQVPMLSVDVCLLSFLEVVVDFVFLRPSSVVDFDLSCGMSVRLYVAECNCRCRDVLVSYGRAVFLFLLAIHPALFVLPSAESIVM